jgi:hypothetical protein
MVLHFLPCSPDASRIEHVWQDPRANVIGYDSSCSIGTHCVKTS